MSRQAYFGGSFDPPHLAHDGMLRALLADPWVDGVHLVPTGINPLKQAAGETPAQRRAWMEAWMDSLRTRQVPGFAKLNVHFEELESTQPSFTVDTLERLKERHGGDWILALGSDLLPQLKSWREWARLLAGLHSVWVFRRGPESLIAASLPDEELKAAVEWRFMMVELPNVSSTQIRTALAEPNASRNVSQLPLLPEIARLL